MLCTRVTRERSDRARVSEGIVQNKRSNFQCILISGRHRERTLEEGFRFENLGDYPKPWAHSLHGSFIEQVFIDNLVTHQALL